MTSDSIPSAPHFVTVEPLSQFDLAAIGPVLLVVMAILAYRRFLKKKS